MLKEKIPERYRRTYWILSRFAAVVIAVSGFFVLVYFLTDTTTANAIRITGVATSALLTFALIAVYRDVGVIQEDQAEAQMLQSKILEKQEEWMAAEHYPSVSILFWKAEGNEFDFELTNAGNGIAQNFNLEMSLFPADNPNELPNFVLGGSTSLSHLGGGRDSRSILAPTNESVLLHGNPPTFSERLTSEWVGSFQDAMEMFEESDSEIVQYEVVFEYENIIEKKTRRKIFVGWADRSDITDIESMLSETYQVHTQPEEVPPDNWDSHWDR